MKALKVENNYRLLCKKHNILTLFGCTQDRLAFTMFPVQLNTLSEGTLMAGMHKYW